MIPRTYYITDEYGNRVVTPEGYFLVWDTEDNAAHAVYPEGLINIPVVCGQISKGSALTISRVTMTGDDGETYTAGDDTGATLTVDGNPYATQGICNDLYAAYNGLVYFPYTATKALYDPATELGDQVKIGDMVHSVMFGAKLTLDHNFRADIQAPNSEELSAEYPYLSEIKRLKQTNKELRSAIAKAETDLQSKVSDTALQAEKSRAEQAELNLADSIGEEKNRAVGVENTLSYAIQDLKTELSNQAASINSLQEMVESISSIVSEIDDRLRAIENGGASE